jgi:hypothetical protein
MFSTIDRIGLGFFAEVNQLNMYTTADYIKKKIKNKTCSYYDDLRLSIHYAVGK